MTAAIVYQVPSWIPRPYQETLITSVLGAFPKYKTVLLAGCPNSGKTSMTIDLIGRLVAQQQTRVLVLAHGTKVLRRQFLDELTRLRPDLVPFVDVRIPQELHRKDLQRYDLVVVDEAHQFYGKGEAGDGDNQKMMKSILGKVKPKNTLLLTGSPARFIAQGFKAGKDMFCFSLEQLHAQQPDAVADVMIECASSHYSIKDDDYTKGLSLLEVPVAREREPRCPRSAQRSLPKISGPRQARQDSVMEKR